MRTDYKIGIAVVLFLAVVIIIYYVFSPPPPPTSAVRRPTEPAVADAGPSSTDSAGPLSVYDRNDNVTEGLGRGYVGRPREDPAVASGSATPGGSSAPGTGDMAASGQNNPSTGSTGAGADQASRDFLADSTSTTGLLPVATDSAGEALSPPSRPLMPVAPAAAKTYVVQTSDVRGFWGIAEKEYGDGKHYPLLVTANPSVDASRLWVGQKLRVPPLATAIPVAVASGRTETPVRDVNGAGVYVVREGDAGFWGIAKKQYGRGHFFTLIAKANRGVDPYRLKVGQKLIIPPRPAAAAPKPTRVLPSGHKWYVVRKGDAGFWDVAEKEYGSGLMWKHIADANKGVNPGRLRIGQRLVVPPRPSGAVARRNRRRPGKAVSRGRRPRYREPIFD